MTDNEIEYRCKQYKRESLSCNKEAVARLHFVLSEQLDEPEQFFRETEIWVAKCLSVRDEVVALAMQGNPRNSIEYDAIQFRVSELGPLATSFLNEEYNNAAAKYARMKFVSNIQTTRSKGTLLNNITFFASWGMRGCKMLEECKNEFLASYPANITEMEAAVRMGEMQEQYGNKAYKLGSTGKSECELDLLINEAKQNKIKNIENKMRKSYKSGQLARRRFYQSHQIISEPNSVPGEVFSKFNISTGAISPMQSKEINLTGIHPNSLTEIPPASSWTVLIDETGSDFTENSFVPGLKKNEYGRVVALFVPEYTTLPDLPTKWHAVDHETCEIKHVVDTIRNNQCGLLGISLRALNTIHGELWLSCIEALLDLAWRLIQCDGETQINIFVEQRGTIKSGNFELLQRMCDATLYHLSRAFPEKAKNLHINARVIAKDEHPWNGYADAAAFTWGGSSVKPLLNQTQWNGTCLIGNEIHSLRRCLDLMEREEYLTAEQWNALVTSPDTEMSNSLVSALLRNLGEQARTDAQLWFSYMDYTCTHLNSKAIDLTQLGLQINWLKAWIPDVALFPPKLRLLWLTVKLAEENHHGKIVQFQKQRDEFKTLSEQLFLEDAPLTCNAALHLAVSYTNEFDFQGAKDVLTSWKSQPPQVPGLQYYGQLLSSFGQHEAFLGNHEAAISYFHKAIETFNALSDSNSAKLDVMQTTAYLLTSLMDAGEAYRNELEQELPKYFGTRLEDAANRLSESDSSNDKYAHHILLRYILSGLAPECVLSKYLANRSKWKTGTGHPWEMIEFYRAMMFDAPEDRLPLLRNAYKLATANDEGMTLRVIAAVILGSIWLDDPSVRNEYLELVTSVTDALPHLAARGDVLRDQTRQRLAPMELARTVLPFNFR